jgi:MIP family channel proteins
MRQLIVEFIGPFALVFLGAGTIILTQGGNLLAIALAHGLAIAVMVAAAGHISGGVYNPALTVGLMATGRMPLDRGAFYILSQLLGGVAGALALKAIFKPVEVNLVNLGTPSVGSGYEPSAAMFAEIIMTFFLMFVVFGAAIDLRGARAVAPLVIGLTITADILAMGGVTGAAMNPARWFGPALVQGHWDDGWVWVIGPVIGAVLAAAVFVFLLMDDDDRDTVADEVTVEAGQVAASEAVRRRRRRR